MESQENKIPKFSHWLKTSITARMIVIGALILILLIPLTYVQLLIEERAYRQENVIREINDKWGDPVYVYGPILKVPFVLPCRHCPSSTL